jgi:membrane protein implicated in regulation of membrane protease activity
MVAAALALLVAERATWPSYLAFALLAVGLIAVVWHNQRVRRRARRPPLGGPEDSERETPE